MLQKLSRKTSSATVPVDAPEYTVEPVGDAAVWEELLASHPLRSVYASSGWGEYKRGSGWDVERYRVIDQTGFIRAIYQLQTQRRLGIRRVLIQGGPLFFECENYVKVIKIVKAMLAQIGTRSNTVVAINFYGFRSDETTMGILASGFVPILNRQNFTLIMDLSQGLDEARAQLNQTARRYLRKAEKNEDIVSRIVVGSEDRREAIDQLASLYDDLSERKKFEKGFHTGPFRDIAADDPRYVISRVSIGGEPASIYIAHVAAERMIGLVTASNDAARASGASYLAIWTLAEYADAHGLSSFDLSGIDPFANFGTFQFKHRISRKLQQSDPLWLYCQNPILRNAVSFALTRS